MKKLLSIIVLLLATQSLTSKAFACNKAASFHNALHLPITIPVSASLSLVGYNFDFLSVHAGIWPMVYICSTDKERK